MKNNRDSKGIFFNRRCVYEKQEKIMPPEVQSSSVALNPSNNPRFKNKVILKRPHTVLMRLSPGEFKAVMEMVSLLLIWNTDGY